MSTPGRNFKRRTRLAHGRRHCAAAPGSISAIITGGVTLHDGRTSFGMTNAPKRVCAHSGQAASAR
ncbi:hypothetical protein CCO03_02275 [Comamonas serinivorans]|uniref:Uncharacterized protein n=1 Tax=Comamonas serinivorans TaxID=1082851 RepID=A0A1Y0EJR3_9BURK|nr:hypothetical protein CCO03_02275 [Comamonas serinivorans]